MRKSRLARNFINQTIAREIGYITAYFDDLLQWLPLPHDNGYLFDLISCPRKEKLGDQTPLPDLREERIQRTAILLNGNFNHHLDIQGLLDEAKLRLSRTSRLIVVAYNPYLKFIYQWASFLGLREGEVPFTFVTRTDLDNIARLSGYEIVRLRPVAHFPFKWLGLGRLINALLSATPGVRWLGLANVIVLRPQISESERAPSISIVIPARNEKGNIEAALRRLPDFGTAEVEVIFVEGHSRDDTWPEILRVAKAYSGKNIKIQTWQQSGKGKGDAVRLGFSKASHELLTILDADLTMPPEKLLRFYHAYVSGTADFINGSRLVYPMEGDAMRFLNRLGNVFFAKSLSYVLDVRIGDSLCGTKLMTKHDYERFKAWRKSFGDFDPFGDFELIFPAADLALGIVDVPVHYLARTYGETNIQRFRHGLMLLKMTLIGFFKIRLRI